MKNLRNDANGARVKALVGNAHRKYKQEMFFLLQKTQRRRLDGVSAQISYD
jgi:hypothetical protein